MITSTSNKKIKNIRSLLTSKKERDRQGLYVIEGIKLFEESPVDKIREVYISEGFKNKEFSRDNEQTSRDKLNKTGFETVSDTVFSKISDTVTPQGIMCLVEAESYDIETLCKAADWDAGLHIIVLEGLQDPGNLGTILRTAEAAGFNFIIADKMTADIYSPKVIRSTMGAVFRVPVAYTDSLPDTVDYLKKQEIRVFAAHLSGDNSYRDIDYGRKCAILIGNEGKGLSDLLTAKADELVKIPMLGNTESLNASVAAALLMFEAAYNINSFTGA